MFPPEFANDMNLNSYRYNTSEPIEYGFSVPSQMMEITKERDLNYSFANEHENSALNWSSYHGENFNYQNLMLNLLLYLIIHN